MLASSPDLDKYRSTAGMIAWDMLRNSNVLTKQDALLQAEKDLDLDTPTG